MLANNAIRILLVEDHWRMRESIKSGLSKYKSLQFVAEAENSQEALIHLESEPIDLIIMDYQLTNESLWGVELTKEILKKFPDIKIIFWSVNVREVDIISAMKVGAHGYLSKLETNTKLKEAIDTVLQSGVVWPSDLSTQIRKKKKLSPMKMRVVALLAQGKIFKQIAYELLHDEYDNKIRKFGIQRVLKESGSFEAYLMEKCQKPAGRDEKNGNLDKKTRWDSRKRTVEGHANSIKKWFGAKSLCMLGKKIIEEGRLEYRRVK